VWSGDVAVPPQLMLAIAHNGGFVALGYVDGDARPAGFVFGFLGIYDFHFRHHSHMLAVRREHRGSGLALALLLHQRLRLRGLFRLLYFLPYVTSQVAVALVWGWVFNPSYGAANGLLASIGAPPQRWLLEPGGIIPPDTTADGCQLPQPPAPPNLEGQGAYKCDPASKSWVWSWAKPDTTPGGCPLPRPVPEPAQAGFGSYVCNPATHHWHWKASTPPPGHLPPPTHTAAHGELSVTAGVHRSWHRASGNGPATDARDFTHAGAAVQFLTGPSELVKLPNGTAVHLARVRHAPGHPAIAGRYMRAGPPAWRWRKAT